MMDAHDTNQPLNQGELEEEKKTVEVSEAITETPACLLYTSHHKLSIESPQLSHSFA